MPLLDGGMEPVSVRSRSRRGGLRPLTFSGSAQESWACTAEPESVRARPMQIPPHILQELWRHAEETYPSECCGFLLGPAGGTEVDELRRCVNQQDAFHERDPERFPRTSRTAYTLDPKDIFFLDRSQRTPRPVRVLYHSHNDVGAYFSAEDKAFALFAGEPAYPVDYLVIDVRERLAREARLFRFDPGAVDFLSSETYPSPAS